MESNAAFHLFTRVDAITKNNEVYITWCPLTISVDVNPLAVVLLRCDWTPEQGAWPTAPQPTLPCRLWRPHEDPEVTEVTLSCDGVKYWPLIVGASEPKERFCPQAVGSPPVSALFHTPTLAETTKQPLPPGAEMTFKVLPTLRKCKRDRQRQTCLRSQVVFQNQLSHEKVLLPIKRRYQAEEEFYSEKPLLVFRGQCHCPLPY